MKDSRHEVSGMFQVPALLKFEIITEKQHRR